MKWKALAVAAVVTAYAAPAMAEEYYIVRDSKTQQCRVVTTTTAPTETTWVRVGPLAFKTQDEAQKQVTTICTSK